MANYAVYVPTTGEIIRIGFCPDGEEIYQYNSGTEGLVMVEADPETQYVVTGSVVSRPLLSTVATWNKTTITANGGDSATFGSSLPNPSAVTFTCTTDAGVPTLTGSVTDGSLTVMATVAGSYLVEIEAFPYQSYTQEITAS